MLDARSNEIFELFKILQKNSYTNKYYKFELPTSFAKYILNFSFISILKHIKKISMMHSIYFTYVYIMFYRSKKYHNNAS